MFFFVDLVFVFFVYLVFFGDCVVLLGFVLLGCWDLLNFCMVVRVKYKRLRVYECIINLLNKYK